MTKSSGPKCLQLKVGARRAPRLLVHLYYYRCRNIGLHDIILLLSVYLMAAQNKFVHLQLHSRRFLQKSSNYFQECNLFPKSKVSSKMSNDLKDSLGNALHFVLFCKTTHYSREFLKLAIVGTCRTLNSWFLIGFFPVFWNVKLGGGAVFWSWANLDWLKAKISLPHPEDKNSFLFNK